jgi:prephenate dehydrogenase
LPRYGTVAIIGVGLIGGSIGLALRARGLARRVVGIGRNEATLAEAQRRGAIDTGLVDLERGVTEAEVTVVCTPVTQVAAYALRAAEHGRADSLVTDAGSTKRWIVDVVEQIPRGRSVFVGAHPIAGSERKGVAHAQADLFERRVCVLTPTRHTSPDRLERAREFWSSLGCRIREMGLDEHDKALALTSHLPHAVAAALAATIPEELLPLAAGAYRDGTRVAASDADLWAGIFRENRQYVLNALLAFQEELGAFRTALESRDQAALHNWWNSARERRLRFHSPDQEAEPRPDGE